MPTTPPPTPPYDPRSLLSEADRERLLALLQEQHSQAQLDLGDLSQRVGIVLASTYSDETAAAVSDLAPLGKRASGEPSPARASRGRFGQRRRHAQQAAPAAGWVPTPKRFRDQSTRAIMRVWIDPADLSRHYVPEPDG